MKLLIVDEDKNTLNDMFCDLTRIGFTVVTQESPFAAIELYKSDNFDAVISEIEMEELNGIELLKKIKEIDKGSHVILMTKRGYFETARDAVNYKAYAYLEKPLDFDELLKYLKVIEIERKNRPLD